LSELINFFSLYKTTLKEALRIANKEIKNPKQSQRIALNPNSTNVNPYKPTFDLHGRKEFKSEEIKWPKIREVEENQSISRFKNDFDVVTYI